MTEEQQTQTTPEDLQQQVEEGHSQQVTAEGQVQAEPEVQLDSNLYFNMNATYKDDDGVEHFGVWQEGTRDPQTHTITFTGQDQQQAEPQQQQAASQSAENGSQEAAPAAEGEGPQATDAAAQKAAELGISLFQIEGTGQGGKITVNDVDAKASELGVS